MPEFDVTTAGKIDDLRDLYKRGIAIQPFEMIKVDWPTPTGAIWYSVMKTDQIADPAPPIDPELIQVRLIADNNPNWFLPVQIDSSIGDEEIDLEMWDADEAISDLLLLHGEGVKTELFYWFPQVDLLLPVWHGHLRNEDEASVDTIKLKAVQGFRSADANVPNRAHYRNCHAVFGGVLDTQEAIDEHGQCDYNKHLGGLIGIDDPSTGLPWTYCNRQGTESCTARGIDPLRHLSHRTITTTILNNQPGGGPRLLITSQGNETNLKEPVPVIMGRRKVYGRQVLAYSIPTVHEEGWFFAIYEVGEGPNQSFSQVVITVAGIAQSAVPLHYNFRLGTPEQTPVGSDITPHNYSSTGVIRYNFGYVDTRNGIDIGGASASAMVEGLNNIRVYSDADTYVEEWTSNRAWQLARILTDKRWGYGYDYDRLNIDSFIDAAAWCDEYVTFTDTFGDQWPHVRSDSHPELIGKKVQQQIEDICMAGQLSRPFLFNGKIHIVPLRELTAEELAAAPVFTDEGDQRNIIWDAGKTTLTISRKSDLDLVNRVECTFDDELNGYAETPLNPVEHIDAQLAAGRVVGDKARKINPKKYTLLGVVNRNQAIKMAWTLLDLGPHDEGGLRNNLKLNFKAWFMDTLDLHIDKVVRVSSSRLTKYGFEYFRVKKMERGDDLQVEIELQAYATATSGSTGGTTPPPAPELLTNESNVQLTNEAGEDLTTE